jgi:hypothetical protein
MPYRFEFREGETNPPIFAEFEDDEAARREALEVTRQTMMDGLAVGVDPTEWMTRGYNEAGYLIGSITFADVVAPSTENPDAPEGP